MGILQTAIETYRAMGRTTRMIEHALRTIETGVDVHILAANSRHARQIAETAYKVAKKAKPNQSWIMTLSSGRSVLRPEGQWAGVIMVGPILEVEVDWASMVVHNKHEPRLRRAREYLFDHFAIETVLAEAFVEHARFEAENTYKGLDTVPKTG